MTVELKKHHIKMVPPLSNIDIQSKSVTVRLLSLPKHHTINIIKNLYVTLNSLTQYAKRCY